MGLVLVLTEAEHRDYLDSFLRTVKECDEMGREILCPYIKDSLDIVRASNNRTF